MAKSIDGGSQLSLCVFKKAGALVFKVFRDKTHKSHFSIKLDSHTCLTGDLELLINGVIYVYMCIHIHVCCPPPAEAIQLLEARILSAQEFLES